MKKTFVITCLLMICLSLFSQNDKQKFDNALTSALQGNVEAQVYVGTCYSMGEGVEKDGGKAFEWFMKAALQGNPLAQCQVGFCFFYGDGTVKDSHKAFEWWMKSALQGFQGSQAQVGLCYYSGDGIAKDLSKAYEWLMKAAQQGDASSQYLVGLCNFKGEGTSKNLDKSFEWCLKAAKQGLADAIINLGTFYNVTAITKQGKAYFEWVENIAKENYAPAYNDLAYCYMQGIGVSKDKNMAWTCINKAIALDSTNINFLDTKGEFYSIEGNVQKALDTWNEINKLSSTYYANHGDTNFSKYIKDLNGDNIDYNVPTSSTENKNTFAIIIANENYQEVSNVPYAINDGNIFTEYCRNTLGIPNENISFVKDATLNNIRREFNWLKQVLGAYNGEASVVVYYAGHGIPDETGKTSYILPIDGIGNDVSTGYNVQDLYTTLSNQPAKKIMVFLDACFSGTNRDGSMLASARGVAIKAKHVTPIGNLVVFSAAQGDETAWSYKDREHGLFTYYLLRKIKETKGDTSLGELGDYVSSEVKKQSILANGKSQTPVIISSPSIGNGWTNWTLK